MSAAGPNAINLTGQWNGTYTYPGQTGPATPFLATIEDNGGVFSGTIIEPDMFYGQPTLDAAISGHRSGRSVDFVKTYSASATGYEHPVDYIGQLSAKGACITGVWSLLDLDGKFEMHRDLAVPEQREEEVGARVGTGTVTLEAN